MKGEKNCRGCGKRRATIMLGFMPRPLCEECFCRNVEKRIRRYIRLEYPLEKGSSLSILDDGSTDAKVLIYSLKNLQKDLPYDLKITKLNKLKSTSIAVPWNINDAAAYFIEGVLFGKNPIIPLAPLSVIHPQEVFLFAKLKDIKGSKKSRLSAHGKKIIKELDNLEKKHPNIKFSIINFSKWIKSHY